MHQSILSSFFFFVVSSFLDVTHLATKKKLGRAQTRWMNASSEPVNREKQKSNTHTYIYTKKKKRRRKNREKENSFFSIYMSGDVRCLSLENNRGRLFFHLLSR
jgi:hypothetical protein